MTYDEWKLATPPEHVEQPEDGDRADEAYEREEDR